MFVAPSYASADGTEGLALTLLLHQDLHSSGLRQVRSGLHLVLAGRRQRGQAQKPSPDGDATEEPARGERRGQQRRSSELLLERPQHGRDGGVSKRQRLMSHMQS